MNFDKLLFFVVLLAACLTQFATDIYTPSLPAIAHTLHYANLSLAQLSLAIYLYGVAATLLIYGPLSDGIGRKTPMLIGIGLMLVGSIICMFANSIYVLIAGRFIQGCGAGACAGLWRSIFRDVFTGEQLAKYGSYFAIFVMFIVPAAPTIGGLLQQYLDWRASFIFISIYTLIVFVLVLFAYKETSKTHHSEKLKLPYVAKTFKRLLTSPIFMGITACNFLVYGAQFAWLTNGPILLIHQLKISPLEFGLLNFVSGGLAYATAGWVNGKCVTRFGMANMLRAGWIITLIAGILMLSGYWIFGLNLWAIMVPVIIFYFGATLIWPNAFSIAFTPFGDIAGYTGALYSFMQLGGGAIIGTLAAYLPTHSQLPLSIIIIVTPILAWLLYSSLVHEKKTKTVEI